MVGKERMLVATLVALAVGSVLAGLAHSIGVLIVARAIQGIGGGVLPLSFGIIRDEFPADQGGRRGVGIIAAMTAVGGGAGIVLAGPIVDAPQLPLAVLDPADHHRDRRRVMRLLFVPESPVRTPGRISWSAAVLLSGWLVALLLGGERGPHLGLGLAQGPRTDRPGRRPRSWPGSLVELRSRSRSSTCR